MENAETMATLDLLLVEDNDADAVLMGEALQETGLPHRLQRVRNGLEAIDYLEGNPPFGPGAQPDLILLDLNLPKMDGREFLFRYQRNLVERSIPVVVLSTSRDEKDRSLAQALPVQQYLVKPMSYDELVERMGSLRRFWAEKRA